MQVRTQTPPISKSTTLGGAIVEAEAHNVRLLARFKAV